MMAEATQTGASEDRKDPRTEAIAEIARRVNEERAPELTTFDEETGTIGPQNAAETEPKVEPKAESKAEPKDEAAEEEPPAETPPAEPATAPPAAAQPPAVADDEYDTITVHGQQIKVPKQQLYEAGRRTLQKETAADRRLQEATEMRRQAEALLARAQRVAQGAALPTEQLPQDAAEQPAQSDGTTFDPKAFFSAVDHQMETRLYVRDAQKAAETFKRDFPDIASDPVLASYAVQLEDARIREATELGNPLGDPYEAYRKHGETIRVWQKQRGLLQPTPTLKEKAERKREATPPVPVASIRSAPPPQDKPKSRSEIIEEMRKGRGQRIA